MTAAAAAARPVKREAVKREIKGARERYRK